MSILFSIGIKIIKPIAIFLIILVYLSSIISCFSFIGKTNQFNFGIMIIGVAVALRLMLNVACFTNFKIVKDYGWITTLVASSIVDVLVFLIPFFIFIYKKILHIYAVEGDNAEHYLSANIKAFRVSNLNTLIEQQYAYLMFLLVYILLTLTIIIYFRKNYIKASN